MDRRTFFRYAAGGAILTGTGSYSSNSHAFAFTAAAIATGEKIGWGAKPFIDAGKEILIDMFMKMMNDATSSLINGISICHEQIYQSTADVFKEDWARKTLPLNTSCNYNELSKLGIQSTLNTKKLTDKLNHSITIDPDYATGSKALLDTGSALSYTLNSNGDAIWNDVAIKNVSDYYSRLGYAPNLNAIHRLSNEQAASIARVALTKAVMNYHMAINLNNKQIDSFEKIKSTYQSEQWRKSLNETSAEISLIQESILQKATENQLLFENLISEQNSLLLECLSAINHVAKMQGAHSNG
ncbi:hypothetical protein M6C35_001957 [Vibrio metschnikovii]|nr:hypothetical protein [Vibrio metschnikovii]